MSQLTYDQLAMAVIELPLVEQKRLLAQISSRLEKNGSAIPASTANGDQQSPVRLELTKDQLWVQANRENYRGEWVILKDGELVGHSKDGVELARAVRLQGVKSPFIAFIPEEDIPWAGF